MIILQISEKFHFFYVNSSYRYPYQSPYSNKTVYDTHQLHKFAVKKLEQDDPLNVSKIAELIADLSTLSTFQEKLALRENSSPQSFYIDQCIAASLIGDIIQYAPEGYKDIEEWEFETYLKDDNYWRISSGIVEAVHDNYLIVSDKMIKFGSVVPLEWNRISFTEWKELFD